MLLTMLSFIACDLPAVTPPASVATSTSTFAPLGTRSRSMPRADEWRTISDAMTSAGVSPDQVFASKFDWLFGDAAPRTGTFTGSRDGQQVWVDVHFLERPIPDVTVCTDQPPATEWTFTVAVTGEPQTLGKNQVTGAATAPLYFAVNERYFVIASDLRLLSSLRTSLTLSEPACPLRRDPNTLPILPWEREFLNAFATGGIDMRMIARSKWESFLGRPMEARVFISTPGQVGADVIYLTEPTRISMCPLPASPGFSRWSMIVDGRRMADLEGSQLIYPLVNAHFFVLTSDASTAAALSRGLGLSLPPC